jgi:hypothetical protein
MFAHAYLREQCIAAAVILDKQIVRIWIKSGSEIRQNGANEVVPVV